DRSRRTPGGLGRGPVRDGALRLPDHHGRRRVPAGEPHVRGDGRPGPCRPPRQAPLPGAPDGPGADLPRDALRPAAAHAGVRPRDRGRARPPRRLPAARAHHVGPAPRRRRPARGHPDDGVRRHGPPQLRAGAAQGPPARAGRGARAAAGPPDRRAHRRRGARARGRLPPRREGPGGRRRLVRRVLARPGGDAGDRRRRRRRPRARRRRDHGPAAQRPARAGLDGPGARRAARGPVGVLPPARGRPDGHGRLRGDRRAAGVHALRLCGAPSAGAGRAVGACAAGLGGALPAARRAQLLERPARGRLRPRAGSHGRPLHRRPRRAQRPAPAGRAGRPRRGRRAPPRRTAGRGGLVARRGGGRRRRPAGRRLRARAAAAAHRPGGL
ncbi:MAG: Serine phosphatase RsbU, regulator of sigma subunit, partial [uncultured Solirubrobacteraceae bacterium]